MNAPLLKRPAVPEGTTVLVIDGDPWRQSALARFLESAGYSVLLTDSPEVPPDLALVDFRDGVRESRPRYESLRAKYPDMKTVAFVSTVSSATVFPCLLLGVKGVLPAGIGGEELLLALAAVRTGSLWAPRAVLSQSIDRIVSLSLDEGGQRALDQAEDAVPGERTTNEPGGLERRELAEVVRAQG